MQPPAQRSPNRLLLAVLIANWFAVLLIAMGYGLLVGFAWNVAFPVLETDHASQKGVRVVRYVLIAVVSFLLSLILATVLTLRMRSKSDDSSTSRHWRRKALWLAVALVLAPTLWGISRAVDHWRHDRVTSLLIGTWHVKSDGNLMYELTFSADGTAIRHDLSGKFDERKASRLGYEVASDGQSFRLRDLPTRVENPNVNWEDYHFIEFHGPDRFRAGYVTWKHQMKSTYERVK